MPSSATLIKISPPKQVLSDLYYQIHFPVPCGIPESALDKLYYTKINDEPVYMKLFDTRYLSFEEITNDHVFKATGMLYFDWRQQWMQEHPETRPHTKMCIYSFKKHP